MNARRLAGLAAVALALLACGGSGDTAEGPRPVTDEEASRLAETLFNDYELGGASFELNGLMPDGTTVYLAGEVDWVNHVGHATVRVDRAPDASVTEVIWAEQLVLERIPALTELAASLGQGQAEWYVRPPDIEGRHLDGMIAVVTSLASQQRDNPVLIAQEPGTSWLRTDVVPGTQVTADVLRFGERTVYWLDEGGVTLYRFEGNNADGTRPVVVDLRGHGPREIGFPPDDIVVDSTLIPDLYEAATMTSGS